MKTIYFLPVILLLLFCNLFSLNQEKSSPNIPKIWFQHDDYVDTNKRDTINKPEFVRDMLTRWEPSSLSQWSRALSNTDVYSFHENLLKVGAPQGMGSKFLKLLRRYFNDNSSPAESLYVRYLRLILPVLHAHNIDIVIHTVGSKGDFVPWQMYGKRSDGTDTTFVANDTGLVLVKNTIRLINRVCSQLFTDGYKVRKVKLQSVLSGIWQRGLKNNVYCALEYMKRVQDSFPDVEFYLGDALLQRRDYNNSLNWRHAYDTLYYTMMYDSNGYSHLNFRGIRIEFDKKWADSLAFENAEGWTHLTGPNGAIQKIHSRGWTAGLEFNHPYAIDEWAYERRIIRTAQKCLELNLNLNFVVLHTDEAGGDTLAKAIPYDVPPENRTPIDTPTFSSVLNKLYDFYNGLTQIKSNTNITNSFVLLQNYPNPFNSETSIEFTVPVKSFVKLTVYDLNGKEVALLAKREFSAGKYKINWNAGNQSSGVYFYEINTGEFSQVRKMILIK